jgi:hypothetical protein
MYYGDSGKILFAVFGSIFLIVAGFYWHQSLFVIRVLADLFLLNLPPHLQTWVRTFFHIHSAAS